MREKRLLVGIDNEGSCQTMHAIHTIGEVFGKDAQRVHILLVSVIAVSSIAASCETPSMIGSYHNIGQSLLMDEVIASQRQKARSSLYKAASTLVQYGFASEHITCEMPSGSIVEELVLAAHAFSADCIVLGNRGHSLLHTLRRVVTGSLSHQLKAQSACPVLCVPDSMVMSPEDMMGGSYMLSYL
jgi:nucleotide-binding universal stress UspA family protein